MAFNYDVTRQNSSQRYSSFKAGVKLPADLTDNLGKGQKLLAKMIDVKEGDSGLSHSRFVQNIVTQLGATLPFTRSLADASEKTFLEVFEGVIFCYLPVILGNTLAKSKMLNKNPNNPASKAALVIGCTAVPAAGYAMSFAKNLFTLKVFNKSDFTNIVNLDKNKTESKEQQKKVEKSALSSIRNSAITAGVGLAAAVALASLGRNSKGANKFGEIFLNPGKKAYQYIEKQGKKVPNGLKNFLDSYGSLDFARRSDGTLGLGKGQLGLTVTAAVCGYFGAAKDRGKLDFLETATRLPLVALYVIFGSELFDAGFKKYLHNRGKFAEILTKDPQGNLNVAKLQEIPAIAKKSGKEVGELFRGKATIAMVPFAFGMLVMGSFVALMSRLWTQHRFNQGVHKTA